MNDETPRERLAKVRRYKDRRYAYLVLALLQVILAVLAIGTCLAEIRINDQKFCQLMQASLKVPVPKPADPKANPSRETNYENYIIAVALGHSLGCPGIPVVKEGKK